MKRSTDRILTTHVGSLIRPAPLQDFLRARQTGKPYDQVAYQSCLKTSVAEVVRKQAEVGVDVVSDGEFGKSISWSQYVLERLSGFERRPIKPGANPFTRGVDRERFAEYYKSEEDLIRAIGAAMRTEYRMIIDAGFVLQLDDARAAVTYDRMVPPASFADYRKWLALQVDVLNEAIAGLPADRIRYHVCWGSWPGPHTSDVALKDIVDLILGMKVGAYVIEGANPRHEHEWRVWETAKLPAGRLLIPGVISHATNVVEHPELVAERIVRIARLVGRENLLAGTDCGFAQGPFYRRVHPSVMWAKLDALAQGARLASRQLWS